MTIFSSFIFLAPTAFYVLTPTPRGGGGLGVVVSLLTWERKFRSLFNSAWPALGDGF